MDTADMQFVTADMRGPAIDVLRGLPAAASQLRAAAFVDLLAGSAPSIARLATVCGTPRHEAERLCRAMHDVGALEVEGGAIVTAAGLTMNPTSHTIAIERRQVFTACAFDAFAIPPALPECLSARSACRLCHRPLAMQYDQGRGVNGGSPFLFWIPGSNISHLRKDFCGGVGLFCSPIHYAAWRDIEPGALGRVHTLDDVERLGRVYWARLHEVGRRVPYAEVRQ
jgi:alkylmercury lyase